MKKNRNKSLLGDLWLIKNRLMRRMTIVLLLFSSFTAVAQNVTVKMKNSSFIQIAKEIQKQTDLTFLYNDAKVGNITGLNPDFTNADVKAVLEYCLKNSGLPTRVAFSFFPFPASLDEPQFDDTRAGRDKA